GFEGVDLLHLFGSEPEHLPVALAARAKGIPVVLSTIAWFDLRSRWHEPGRLVRRAWNCGKLIIRRATPFLPSWRRRLYHAVDRLLPNSHAEAEQLAGCFQVPRSRIHVVPNGADERFHHPRTCLPPEVERLGRFVLYSGRIEPRKNQLGFLRAMRGTSGPIVVLGDVVPGWEKYGRACRREAGPNTTFVPRLSHDDPTLEAMYAACACLALCSWFETPGLAALEAGMSGAPLVVTPYGCAREYFRDLAEYAPPDCPRRIQEAVTSAMNRERSEVLAEWVYRKYSWSQAALETRAAYDSTT
ncbi:MAG: glycosyltransferase family 4 protein, partial [Planctomycetales bacterium]